MYDDDRDALAAEYVLGTLSGDERSQAETLMSIDPAFEAVVRQWERRLGELNVMVEAVEPAPEVWERILASIRPAATIAPAMISPSAVDDDEVKLPRIDDAELQAPQSPEVPSPVAALASSLLPPDSRAADRKGHRGACGYRFGQTFLAGGGAGRAKENRTKRRRRLPRREGQALASRDTGNRRARSRDGVLHRRRAIRARTYSVRLAPAGLADDVGAGAWPWPAGWSGRRLATGADRASVSAYPRHAEANADCAPGLGHARDGPQLRTMGDFEPFPQPAVAWGCGE